MKVKIPLNDYNRMMSKAADKITELQDENKRLRAIICPEPVEEPVEEDVSAPIPERKECTCKAGPITRFFVHGYYCQYLKSLEDAQQVSWRLGHRRNDEYCGR